MKEETKWLKKHNIKHMTWSCTRRREGYKFYRHVYDLYPLQDGLTKAGEYLLSRGYRLVLGKAHKYVKKTPREVNKQ